jgi:hypothetical protein
VLKRNVAPAVLVFAFAVPPSPKLCLLKLVLNQPVYVTKELHVTHPRR